LQHIQFLALSDDPEASLRALSVSPNMRLCSITFAVFSLLCTSLATADCNCGYYDPLTKNLFTEYLIVYFNETETSPSDIFSIQSYEHGYEKSWNARYRNGANSSNVALATSPPSYIYPANISLELALSPSTKLHLVRGADIQSVRRDIQYGSFRALIRPSQAFAGGSAVSFGLDYKNGTSHSGEYHEYR